MKSSNQPSTLRPRFRIPAFALPAGVCLAMVTASLQAGPVPQNLGYGLDKLVESNLQLQGKLPTTDGTPATAAYNGYATEAAADVAAKAITEADSGRFLVDITLGGNVPFGQVRKALVSQFPGLTITAVDKDYRGVGIIEGYVSVDDVPAVSQVKGVRAVILALKPDTSRVLNPEAKAVKGAAVEGPTPEITVGQTLTKLGTAFDQGVVQHRVDFINQFYNPSATSNITGNGISIGAMSDSFDTRQSGQTAATNVTNYDLPGSPTNPAGNTTPVNVLIDETGAGTDEGRGMVQNIYKMAPRAKLAYATGVNGEVAFANYIRAMANIPGYENTFGGSVPFKGFKADVICDDISYGGEPFYGETIIGNGIDDATAAGVSYFSSAGNNIGINAYESALRVIPNGTGATAAAGNTALIGTNIDLTGVPAGLYAGGFHNFNPNGQDVACLWNLPAASTTGSTEMQWDDPYDIRTPTVNQPPIFSGSGTTNGTFTVNLTSGQSYVVQETATSGNFDGIVTITDPSGNVVVSQDTGTDETVTFFAPASGNFTITVTPFSTTTGNFTLTVNTSTATLLLTTDLNLLVFRADTGAYISARSLTTNNLANNRPVELGSVYSPTGQTQVQFVIARANNPSSGQRLPTRVRVSTRGNGAAGIGPAEYFTYNAVTTKGHATAAGCNGTAAYSVFKPNQPETFTSPGPATILFDKNANLLPNPIIRLSPTVAAIDAANTSDFGGDSASDPDTNPNFSGTSSAAPHAAAIAALVLEAKGGPGSVTPAQMRSILQRSAFPHDLDPSFASASVRTSNGGKVNITISSDNDSNGPSAVLGAGGTGQNDPNSFVVSYVGSGSITSLTFNPGGTGSTGGNVTGGANGEIDTNGTATSPTVTYFQSDVPGLVFLPNTRAFSLGNSTGLTASDITVPTVANAGFSNAAGAPTPASTGYYTMALNFPTGNFTGGKALRFTVGRGAQRSSSVAGSTAATPAGTGTTTVNPLADLFGGGVKIPEGTVINDGMSFSGTTSGGGTFTGTIKNRIGAGYSPVDGYGLINAQTAVGLPIQ